MTRERDPFQIPRAGVETIPLVGVAGQVLTGRPPALPPRLWVTEATVAASAAMLQGKSTTQPRKARRSYAAAASPFRWMTLLIFSSQKGRGKRNTMERQVMI
jgi:hypothetical protein